MPVFSRVCQELKCTTGGHCFGAVHLVGPSYEEGIYQGLKMIRIQCDCPCHFRSHGRHDFNFASGSNEP